MKGIISILLTFLFIFSSCGEPDVTYKYIEYAIMPEGHRLSHYDTDILAPNDSVAYIKSYTMFCVRVQVADEVGSDKEPVGFRVMDQYGKYLPDDLGFEDQEELEEEIWNRILGPERKNPLNNN